MVIVREIATLPLMYQLVTLAWMAAVGALGVFMLVRGWRGDRGGRVRRCPACDQRVDEGLTCSHCRFHARGERSLHFVRRQWTLVWGGLIVLNLAVPIVFVEVVLGGYWLIERGWSSLLLLPVAAALLIGWRGPRPTGPRCPACRYDMSAIESGICPECGRESPARALYGRRRRHWALVTGMLVLIVSLACTPGLELAAPIGAGVIAAAAAAAHRRSRRRWVLVRRMAAAAVIALLGSYWAMKAVQVRDDGFIAAVPTTALIIAMDRLSDDWAVHQDSSLFDRLHNNEMWAWQRHLAAARARGILRNVSTVDDAERALIVLGEFDDNYTLHDEPTPAGHGLVSFIAKELATSELGPNSGIVFAAPFRLHPEAIEPYVDELVEQVVNSWDSHRVFSCAVYASCRKGALEAVTPELLDRMINTNDRMLWQACHNVLCMIALDCTEDTLRLSIDASNEAPDGARWLIVLALREDPSGSAAVTDFLLKTLRNDPAAGGSAAIALADRGESLDVMIPLAFDKLESDAPDRVQYAHALWRTHEALRPYAERYGSAVNDEDIDVLAEVVRGMQMLYTIDDFPLEPWAADIIAAHRRVHDYQTYPMIRQNLKTLIEGMKSEGIISGD